MQVKDVNASAQKWSNRANAAGQDYVNNAQATQKDQAALAAAAAPVWAAAVQAAASTGRYAKRVLAATTAKWKNGVKIKGATRYPDGVQKSGGNYAAGVAPFFQALANEQLPARQTKGNNASRSQAVVQTLMATKANM
jgi:hypothetical protein